jgi:hypothetical protein
MFRAGTTICAQGVVKRYSGAAEIEVALWDPQDRLLAPSPGAVTVET